MDSLAALILAVLAAGFFSALATGQGRQWLRVKFYGVNG